MAFLYFCIVGNKHALYSLRVRHQNLMWILNTCQNIQIDGLERELPFHNGNSSCLHFPLPSVVFVSGRGCMVQCSLPITIHRSGRGEEPSERRKQTTYTPLHSCPSVPSDECHAILYPVTNECRKSLIHIYHISTKQQSYTRF